MAHFIKYLESFFLPPDLPGFGRECILFSPNPIVIYLNQYSWYENHGKIFSIFHRFPRKKVTLLVCFYWTQEGERQIGKIQRQQARHLKKFPGHRIVYLANTEKERHLLMEHGFESYWINHNIFVDPRVFYPIPEYPKRYDAIYDARLTAFKRHHLAAEIPSLALITYLRQKYHREDYVRQCRDLLAQAHWFNGPFAENNRRLGHREVNECLNQCRVGLCLSNKEGAMFASMQYLLAGLPVVSTTSTGGRDVFFDPDYVEMVDDHPASVAAGVRKLATLNISGETVRRRTLEKIEVHKNRLFALLGKVAGERDWPGEWNRWMENARNPQEVRTVKTFISSIKASQ